MHLKRYTVKIMKEAYYHVHYRAHLNLVRDPRTCTCTAANISLSLAHAQSLIERAAELGLAVGCCQALAVRAVPRGRCNPRHNAVRPDQYWRAARLPKPAAERIHVAVVGAAASGPITPPPHC